jgi:hypothetical protein
MRIAMGADTMSGSFFFRRSLAATASALLGFCILISVPFGAVASDLKDQLVGTWRLVRYFDTDASGKRTYPFGDKPIGYLVYDSTGHMSAQVMRTPPPRFASGDDAKGTDAEVRAAYDGFVAYFGTYRVDEAKSVVTHVVEGSLRPSYVGTDQPRPVELRDDALIIQGRSADGSAYFREFRRVK